MDTENKKFWTGMLIRFTVTCFMLAFIYDMAALAT